MNHRSPSTPSDALSGDDVIVMDGATSTEIFRRGSTLHDIAWSAFAHVDNPDLVCAIHQDYIEAGARIIVANTFSTTKSILDEAGAGDRFEHLNRSAVALAKQARERSGVADVWIAGSISTLPPLNKPGEIPSGKTVIEYYKRQAELLCDAGVDLLIAEMMLDSDATNDIVDACANTGVPIWVGLTASYNENTRSLISYRPSGKYNDMAQQSFTDFVTSVIDDRVAAFGIMHTKVPLTAMALECLRQHWSGFTFAYAETGFFTDPGWDFNNLVAPDAYAQHARNWINDFGINAIGGCCGTNPTHIKALAEMVSRLDVSTKI